MCTFACIILILIYILYKNNCYVTNSKVRYYVAEYPALNQLTMNLINNLHTIQTECKVFVNKPVNIHLNRESGKWTDNIDFENNVAKLKDNNEWVYGWTNDKKWLNYLILSKGEFMPDIKETFPELYETLYPYRHGFNLIGLSVLLGNSELPEHTDIGTSYENGNLAYHYNIYCPNDYNNKGKSIINIGENELHETIEQKTGNYLIFDPSYLHSVVNNNTNSRIILYSDFSIEAMNNYLVCEVTDFQYDDIHIKISPSNKVYYNFDIMSDEYGKGKLYYVNKILNLHQIVFDKAPTTKIHIGSKVIVRLVYK